MITASREWARIEPALAARLQTRAAAAKDDQELQLLVRLPPPRLPCRVAVTLTNSWGLFTRSEAEAADHGDQQRGEVVWQPLCRVPGRAVGGVGGALYSRHDVASCTACNVCCQCA